MREAGQDRGEHAEQGEREHLLLGDLRAPQLRRPEHEPTEHGEGGAVGDVDGRPFVEHGAGQLEVDDGVEHGADHADDDHAGAEEGEQQRAGDAGPDLLGPGLGDHRPEEQRDDGAEQWQTEEEGQNNEVGDDVGRVATEVHREGDLAGDTGEGGDTDEGEPGEHDLAERVALAEGDGQHLGEQAERREGVDVGHRLAEEHAHPVADARRATEGESGVAVVDEEVDDGTEHDRHRHDQTDGLHERRPGEERDPTQAHPGCPAGEHGGGDSTGRGEHTDDHQPVGGQEEVDHLGVAAVDATIAGECDDGERRAAEPRIEPGQGEAGEGERAGADLHRHDGDGETERQRDGDEEDETHALQLEQLQQTVGREDIGGVIGALQAEQRTDHGDADQAEQAETGVQPPDLLVIGRGGPVGHGGEERPDGSVAEDDRSRRLVDARLFDGGHLLLAHFRCALSPRRRIPDGTPRCHPPDAPRHVETTRARLTVPARREGNPQGPAHGRQTRMSTVMAPNSSVT